MSYTVGIGALIEGSAFNTIRDIELQLAAKTKNLRGLSQPPHITVKLPFEVSGVEQVQAVIEMVDKISANSAAFDVKLNGYASFETKVLYAKPQNTKQLTALHHDLMSALYLLKVAPDSVEGESMVFHSTLAKDLSETEFETAESELKTVMPDEPMHCHIMKLGLFLSLDNSAHWAVINESPLGK